MIKKPLIIIISGPSQVGKDAIVRRLLKLKRLNMKKAVTYTTRKKRPEERAGVDHFFITPAEFKALIHKGSFLEWAPVRGKMFGTAEQSVTNILNQGKNVLLKIDVRGASQASQKIRGIRSIFILPQSWHSLMRRMKNKGFKHADLLIRQHEARQEIKAARSYDFQVINYDNKLSKTVKIVAAIILGLTKGEGIVKIKRKLKLLN